MSTELPELLAIVILCVCVYGCYRRWS